MNEERIKEIINALKEVKEFKGVCTINAYGFFPPKVHYMIDLHSAKDLEVEYVEKLISDLNRACEIVKRVEAVNITHDEFCFLYEDFVGKKENLAELFGNRKYGCEKTGKIVKISEIVKIFLSLGKESPTIYEFLSWIDENYIDVYQTSEEPGNRIVVEIWEKSK